MKYPKSTFAVFSLERLQYSKHDMKMNALRTLYAVDSVVCSDSVKLNT